MVRFNGPGFDHIHNSLEDNLQQQGYFDRFREDYVPVPSFLQEEKVTVPLKVEPLPAPSIPYTPRDTYSEKEFKLISIEPVPIKPFKF